MIQKDLNAVSLKGAQEGLSSAQKSSANNVADMKDNITTMETTVSDAEKAYNKTRNLYDQGQASKSDLDAAENALDKVKRSLDSLHRQLKALQETNTLAQAETQLESAEVNKRSIERALDNLEVKAPTSGILTDLNVEVGQSVTAGYRAGEVQQINPVKIKSQLTEASASLVRGKTELTFYIPDVLDKTTAPITYLSDVINGQTKAYDLELEIPNPDGKIKPGSKAQIQLTKEDEQIVPVVPTLSIVREGGDNFVYILNGDIAEKRKVELGRLNETNQEIISGVKEGEILITSGQHQLKDKDKVQVAN
ncbi:efflux RND transporter periplasmic adaptor subunit [Paenibacillus hexagrammi]|uniref:Efflux RND transporter periplasmic adaptor subunit n=1 Tax=Paenibacillus hexagrammi TaxID=2908839 RepID=A0ABY3SMQ4_9BACL|nr:efflux RND transporter periplasmic adaptor subunit [Paenibacillus sp. YPD9-1]UJF35178.1 efflux RND transporter periplasmic adaptor subunit [Paenibacillus sp. YPD9-1]